MALNKGLSDKYCSHSASNEYPQHMFLQKSKKNINTFWLKKKNKSGAMLHGEKNTAPDKVLFSTEKYLYFSYFSMKTYVVGQGSGNFEI